MKTYMQPWLRNTIIQKFSFTRLGKRCEIIGYIYTKIHNDLLTTKTLPTKVSEEVEAHVCSGTFPSSYFGWWAGSRTPSSTTGEVHES